MSAEEAKAEMDEARLQILTCEKEIQAIKAALRQLQGAASADGGEEGPNSLEVAVLKVSTAAFRVFTYSVEKMCSY